MLELVFLRKSNFKIMGGSERGQNMKRIHSTILPLIYNLCYPIYIPFME
jgi:hypothetical protein